MRCQDCIHLDEEKKECSIKEGSPIRKCIIAINMNFISEAKKINEKFSVLDVGCGKWSYIKEHAPPLMEWHGIDVKEEYSTGEKTIATKIGSVSDIPYPEENFDFVFSNQSIEHWQEYGVSFQEGLDEINRVLKKGGALWINFPIHLHGNPLFVKGDEEKILSLFKEKDWSIDTVERWRKDHHPLEKYKGWLYNSLTNDDIPNAENASTWIMNIVARKK